MSNQQNDNSGLGMILLVAGFSLPIYAAIKDYKNSEELWSILDIILAVPVGVIRGFLYFIGQI